MFNRLFANHRVKSFLDICQLKKNVWKGMKISPNFLKVLRKQMHNLIFKKKEKENNKKFTLNIGNLIRM